MASGEAEPDWRRLNRANWEERVGVHLGPRGYDLTGLRAGRQGLGFVEAELGPVDGLKLLHLQCHIGSDSLALAQLGAEVTGVDFSPAAIEAARALAAELGLAPRARFVEADVYEAPQVIGGAESFDCVFSSWGTICWLPDLNKWAKVIAHFLRPEGFFYFAEGHPIALAFDDSTGADPGRPGFYAPYLSRERLILTDPKDYADPEARLVNATTHECLHPLGDVVTALIEAGLQLDWLHEHESVAWRIFQCLVRGEDGFYRWPDRLWLPLAFSLRATKRNMLWISSRDTPK